MMAEQEILVEKTGPVARIVLNRPEKRNAQGVTFSASMLRALDAVEQDPDVHVVVLAANGPVFGGGGDLAEIMSTERTDREWEFELIRGYNKVVARIASLDRPIIAAVNGPAYGGGVCLALACDFAVAGESAGYHFAFARIGLSAADMGAPTLLQRALGSNLAAYYLLTGGTIDATRGRELGLFADVVPDVDLVGRVDEIARNIAAQSRRGTTITKLALRLGAETGFETSLEYEAYLQSFAFRTDEHKRRLGRFLKKD
ncbi:MAG: enoyl-CoA hydratase/isomerase family protein [Ectothiorhodospiraceae bacterium]|nr:enoyl-CoA hydratase/isomerase family protein [Ectothiorhodospiraceae bacterium]